MTDASVYQDVRKNLEALRNFIINNEQALRSGLDSLSGVVPQVRHLTGNVVTIMEQFRATLEDVKTITYSDIELLMDFSGHLQSFLSRKNPLLPEEPEHSTDVSNGSQLLSGLNDLAQMREELVQITEDIIFQIRGLRPEQATPAPAWVN
jgi:hypothetical protein